MKVKQKCLTTSWDVYVDEKINKYLNDGWLVKFMKIDYESRYITIIFEKEAEE